jgi:hypothetical protein
MESPILVCAMADDPIMVAGTSFAHRCAHCQRAVMMSPSGQKFLRENAAALVICAICFVARADKCAGLALPAPLDEILRELKTGQPNYRRQRN